MAICAHKTSRNWLTFLWMPLLPLNKTGDFSKCLTCKSLFTLATTLPISPAGVATSASQGADLGDSGREVAYNTGDWDDSQFDRLTGALVERRIPWYVEATDLIVDKRFEGHLDELVRIVVGDEAPDSTETLLATDATGTVESSLAPPTLSAGADEREITYDVRAWDEGEVALITADLDVYQVAWYFDGDDLVVALRHEIAADYVIKNVTGEIPRRQ